MSVLIVIGLPGSGKSHYSVDLKDYIVYDDCLFSFYDGKALTDIKKGRNVCLNDPRLCDFLSFERLIEKIKVFTGDISLVLFTNNPEQCLKNTHNRDNKRGISKSILQYSKIYNLENYKQYKHVILPVYQ